MQKWRRFLRGVSRQDALRERLEVGDPITLDKLAAVSLNQAAAAAQPGTPSVAPDDLLRLRMRSEAFPVQVFSEGAGTKPFPKDFLINHFVTFTATAHSGRPVASLMDGYVAVNPKYANGVPGGHRPCRHRSHGLSRCRKNNRACRTDPRMATERKHFGTDGVRGVANTDLSPALAMALGAASAHVLRESNQAAREIVVGRDPRLSGDLLEAALIAGICSQGVNVLAVGVLPTPGVAYLTKQRGRGGGRSDFGVAQPDGRQRHQVLRRGRQRKLADATEMRIEARWKRGNRGRDQAARASAP
jgi:hypothetical protein